MNYLAQPYSHPDPTIRRTRFIFAQRLTAKLLLQGENIFSPIVYAHDMALTFEMNKDAGSWMKFNLDMLRHCDMMFVLALKGWEESKGLQVELNVAKMLSLPIYWYDHEFNLIDDPRVAQPTVQ